MFIYRSIVKKYNSIIFASCNSRKYPDPPQKGFFIRPPTGTPPGNSNEASFISLIFWPYRTPHPPGNSNFFCWGSMDIFWNYTFQLMHFICNLFYSISSLSHKSCHTSTKRQGEITNVTIFPVLMLNIWLWN